jgi:hypothetical protein
MLCILPKEEVRDVDLVLILFVTVGEQVSTLQGLRAESEDVVNDENRLLRRGGSGLICIASATF